jgi:hypothetical protein
MSRPRALRLLLVAAPLALISLGRATPPRPVAAFPRAIGAIHPRLSPDGSTIAVSYQGSIWRLPREGGTMRRLTRGPAFDTEPAWSPDGKTIAFVAGWNGPVRLIDAETGAPRALAGQARASGKLYFHPDGTRLLGNFGGPAWLNLADGTTTPLAGPPAALRSTVYALSPDGRHVALATHQDVAGEQSGHNGPQADLWIVASEGGESLKLGRIPSRVFDLLWSGSDLILSSDVGGAHNNLWSVSIDDPTHAHQLTRGHADEDRASTDAAGRWMVYADNRENATAIVVRALRTGDERTISIAELDFAAPSAELKLAPVDRATGHAVTARLSIQHKADGTYHAPPGALYRMEGPLVFFYGGSDTALELPVGEYVVRAFRGLEYRETRQEIRLDRGELYLRLELDRWVDPEAEGWFGGESHIHANYGYGAWYNTPETIRKMIDGEGLNVANMVVANSDTDGVFDREFFRGAPDPLSTPRSVIYWNEEFRATLWGHLTLYNLKHLVEPIFTGFKDTTNPYDVPTNADVADHVHLQGGHVNFTHPASTPDPFLGAYAAKSIPVDVALGKIDSLDVNASYAATVPLWYRLLNCGFRLPASAGTDCFLNRIQGWRPGADRAYVKLDGPFSYAAWVAGLKAGRSFVTNGPMLSFSAGDVGLGGTVKLDAPGDLRVSARARAAGALERLELVHNGQVIAAGDLGPDRTTAQIDRPVRLERGGWLSARAYGEGGRQAHTSPIYVEVGGRGFASPDDAAYFLTWIDRLEAKLKERDRVPTPALREHVAGQLNAARAIYAKMAK